MGSVVIGADGVTLDCAGHRIAGAGWAGIDLTARTGVTIRNGRVSGFTVGMWLNGSSGNAIVGNKASGNANGILLFGGSSNKVFRGNDANGNVDYGIFLDQGSNANTVAGNVAKGMQYSGIFLLNLSNNTLTGNTTSSNGGAPVGPLDAGQGIYLFNADHTMLDGNSASGNVSDGFQLRGATHTLIQNNRSLANRRIAIGLFADDFGTLSTRNTITGNLARGNATLDAQDIAAAGANTWTNNNLGKVSLP
jgi:parallel beta-helix repeat protein